VTDGDARVELLSSTAVWSTSGAASTTEPLVVLLHGRGGTEDDLTSIFPMLPSSTVAVALRGCVPHADRWAWFDPEGDPAYAVDDVVDLVTQWVTHAWPAGPVGVLGFSQGGALALALLRRSPQRLAYAGQICGFHLPGRPADDAELARRRPPVFSAYGGNDDVIDRRQARRTTAWLRGHTDVDEHYYPSLGHEISDEVLGDAAAFVSRRR
jgi:phospholipase/carboxylesterase